MAKGCYVHLILCLLLAIPIQGGNRTHVATLMNDLLTGYDTSIRPFYDQRMDIMVGFYLFSIQELDEKSGVLTSVGGPYYGWLDPRLAWNPSDYGDIENFPLPTNKVWYPNLYLLNPADKMEPIADTSFFSRPTYFGFVWRYLSSIMKTSCSVDMTYFPFDTQECQIELSPWGFSSDEIYLKNASTIVDMTYFQENAQWKVVGTRLKEHRILDFEGIVAAVFSLKRKPEYFVVNIIAPIFMLCLLNPLVFLLPTESGERISYTITIFLSLAVFMTLISDNMPKSSEPMARLSYILLATMAYSTTLCVLSIFLMRVHFRCKDKPIPRWLYATVALLRCKCLCCCRRKKRDSSTTKVVSMSEKPKAAFSDDEESKDIKQEITTWVEMAAVLDGICFAYSCIFLGLMTMTMFLLLLV